MPEEMPVGTRRMKQWFKGFSVRLDDAGYHISSYDGHLVKALASQLANNRAKTGVFGPNITPLFNIRETQTSLTLTYEHVFRLWGFSGWLHRVCDSEIDYSVDAIKRASTARKKPEQKTYQKERQENLRLAKDLFDGFTVTLGEDGNYYIESKEKNTLRTLSSMLAAPSGPAIVGRPDGEGTRNPKFVANHLRKNDGSAQIILTPDDFQKLKAHQQSTPTTYSLNSVKQTQTSAPKTTQSFSPPPQTSVDIQLVKQWFGDEGKSANFSVTEANDGYGGYAIESRNPVLLRQLSAILNVDPHISDRKGNPKQVWPRGHDKGAIFLRPADIQLLYDRQTNLRARILNNATYSAHDVAKIHSQQSLTHRATPHPSGPQGSHYLQPPSFYPGNLPFNLPISDPMQQLHQTMAGVHSSIEQATAAASMALNAGMQAANSAVYNASMLSGTSFHLGDNYWLNRRGLPQQPFPSGPAYRAPQASSRRVPQYDLEPVKGLFIGPGETNSFTVRPARGNIGYVIQGKGDLDYLRFALRDHAGILNQNNEVKELYKQDNGEFGLVLRHEDLEKLFNRMDAYPGRWSKQGLEKARERDNNAKRYFQGFTVTSTGEGRYAIHSKNLLLLNTLSQALCDAHNIKGNNGRKQILVDRAGKNPAIILTPEELDSMAEDERKLSRPGAQLYYDAGTIASMAETRASKQTGGLPSHQPPQHSSRNHDAHHSSSGPDLATVKKWFGHRETEDGFTVRATSEGGYAITSRDPVLLTKLSVILSVDPGITSDTNKGHRKSVRPLKSGGHAIFLTGQDVETLKKPQDSSTPHTLGNSVYSKDSINGIWNNRAHPRDLQTAITKELHNIYPDSRIAPTLQALEQLYQITDNSKHQFPMILTPNSTALGLYANQQRMQSTAVQHSTHGHSPHGSSPHPQDNSNSNAFNPFANSVPENSHQRPPLPYTPPFKGNGGNGVPPR